MEKVYERLAVLENRMEAFEKGHSEFINRTDERLNLLLTESHQWEGVRKTLLTVVSLISVGGTVIGWFVHQALVK